MDTCGYLKYKKYRYLIDNNLFHICTDNTRCTPDTFLRGILDKGTKFRTNYLTYTRKGRSEKVDQLTAKNMFQKLFFKIAKKFKMNQNRNF